MSDEKFERGVDFSKAWKNCKEPFIEDTQDEFQVVWPRPSFAEAMWEFYRKLDEKEAAATAINAVSYHVDYAAAWKACTTPPTSQTLFGEIASTSRRLHDVEDIVMNYLRTNGYDGLCNTFSDCGCETDDLAPCGNMELDCQPGYRRPCPPKCGEHDYHIVAQDPE